MRCTVLLTYFSIDQKTWLSVSVPEVYWEGAAILELK